MDQVERELLLRFVPADERLRRLYSEHVKLEKEVERIERYARYSPSAALHQAELKKRKLRGKEEMMIILDGYRHQADAR